MSLWDTFYTTNSKNDSRIRKASRIPKHNLSEASLACCAMDLPQEPMGSDLKLRSRRRRLGEKLAQSKAFQSPPGADCFNDGSTVVHRRHEDWSTQQSYSSCIFLDDNDTVLASDVAGKLDLIRLPRCSGTDKPRLLGTQLVSNLQTIPSVYDSSTFKMKSLQGGRAFVIGMPCGTHHVFSTERAGCWGDNCKLPQTSFSQQSPSAVIKRAWKIDGPRRRYYRDRHNAHLSLAHMIRGERFQDHDQHDFREIDGWNSDKFSRHRTTNRVQVLPHQQPPDHANWDFLETQSSLLSAHVDAEHDSFWLRLSDDRVHKPILCVDRSSRDKPPTREEHVTACAFASDLCLATAHVWHRGTPGRNFDGSEPVNTCVKLWDIRMLSRQQQKPLGTVTLPQFPDTRSLSLEPNNTIYGRLDDKGKFAMGHSQGGGDHVITNLVASDGNSGTLLITAQSQSKSGHIEHHLLNLGRLKVTRIIRQTNKNPDCLPVYGVAASQNYMACLSSEETMSSIYVYNLHHTSFTRPCGQKRLLHGVAAHAHEDCSWSSRINPVLKDRHGLQTQLTCITMNRNGTAILGGSTDGDLFVWRGS